MEICVLAKIVLLLSIIVSSFSTCVFGISIIAIAFDILFTLFLVFITNMYCEFWIAKGIVIFSLFFAVVSIAMCFTKDKIHKIIIEEELNRQKQN
jgi:hypothetical protein